MERAVRGPASRQGEIEPPAAALGLTLRLDGLGQSVVDQHLELLLGLVRGEAKGRPLLGRSRAKRTQEQRQLALTPEKANADLLELRRRVRRVDCLARLLLNWVDARVRHELPALGFGGLGELRERRRVGDRQLRQHLAIEVDAGLLEARP